MKKKTPKLLRGGNPQVAKADGNAPVQAYIHAIPGWKQKVAAEIDALITKAVPGVVKAVKWNSAFYGMKGKGWFVAFHMYTNYVKVTFFKGIKIKGGPKGGTAKEARWVDLREDDLNKPQLKDWAHQASQLPGWGKI